jgi:hypothetical protein
LEDLNYEENLCDSVKSTGFDCHVAVPMIMLIVEIRIEIVKNTATAFSTTLTLCHSQCVSCMYFREDIFQGRNLFYLVIEGEVVNDRIATFNEAVISLITSYYTLSLEYPPSAVVTLEFIQR